MELRDGPERRAVLVSVQGPPAVPWGPAPNVGKQTFCWISHFRRLLLLFLTSSPHPILSSCERINLRAPVQMLLAAAYPGGRDAGCVYGSAAMEAALNKAAQTVGAAASFPGAGVPVLMTRVHDGHIIRAIPVQSSGRPQTARLRGTLNADFRAERRVFISGQNEMRRARSHELFRRMLPCAHTEATVAAVITVITCVL